LRQGHTGDNSIRDWQWSQGAKAALLSSEDCTSLAQATAIAWFFERQATTIVAYDLSNRFGEAFAKKSGFGTQGC
jgi:hypothetical protein